MNLKPKEMAEKLNVTVKTLQRWDRDGILTAKRTPTGRRYYEEWQVDYVKNLGANKPNTYHGIIDRGYKLIWETEPENEESPNHMLVSEDDDLYDETDALYEDVYSGYSLSYSLNGLEISDELIYNVIMDYAITEFEQGNKNVGKLIYPMMDEHSEIIKTKSTGKSQLQKIVNKYIMQLIKED